MANCATCSYKIVPAHFCATPAPKANFADFAENETGTVAFWLAPVSQKLVQGNIQNVEYTVQFESYHAFR